MVLEAGGSFLFIGVFALGFYLGAMSEKGNVVIVERVTKSNQNSTEALQHKDDIAYWNLYTFNSPDSTKFPSVSFKYPPTLKIFPSIYGIEFHDLDGYRALMFNFSSELPVVFDAHDPTPTFEQFVEKVAQESHFDKPKYFSASSLRVARLRHVSKTSYDGDAGLYFVELSNKKIVKIETSYGPELLYDDDQKGFSTIDKMISTLVLK